MLRMADKKPSIEIATLVSRSEAFISKLIVARLGRKPYIRRPTVTHVHERTTEGESPVCHRCRSVLTFDTDWIGRTLEWCDRCHSTPSTCGPRRAA